MYDGATDSLGYAILWDTPCFTHILVRIDETAFRKADLVCKLHATAFTYNDTKVLRAQLSALAVLAKRDLQVGFVRGARPPPEFRTHADTCLRYTLLRHRHTWAANPGDTEYETNGELDALVVSIHMLLNGNWRLAWIQHYCVEVCPCNGDINVCADMIVAVLAEAVFIRIGRRVPALSRWSSFSPSLVSQALGFLISLVVPRTRQLVGAATNDDHAQPVPLAGLPDRELSFQEYKSKKRQIVVGMPY